MRSSSLVIVLVLASSAAAKDVGIPFPKGTRLQAEFADNKPAQFKPEEQVAYLLVWSIHSLENRCHRELNRACTLEELVRGVPGKERIIGLKVDPAKDRNYKYSISDVSGDYKTSAVPQRPGLGGFLEDTGTMGGFYFNPDGPATRKSKEIVGNGWGVGPHAEGGDYQR